MIALLTAVGVVTSAVFLALRDDDGTVMFHNFLAVYGVLRTLIETGKGSEYATPMAPLLITGIGSVALIMAARMLVLRDVTPRRPGHHDAIVMTVRPCETQGLGSCDV